jgi:membrane associated rhomboid family serine protease
MFIVRCTCGAAAETSAAQFDEPTRCPACGREIVCVSTEAIDDASANFDATLLVVAGATHEAQVIALGGGGEITVGSEAGNTLVIPGQDVATRHCRFVRLNSGLSRWKIEDLGSPTGVLINGKPASSHDLQAGDTIEIGEYELRYEAAPAGDLLCPSCMRRLVPGAKICVDCGIRIPSGRPLLTEQEMDENSLYGNTETVARLLSWFCWVMPLPVPLAFQASGRFKPWVTWLLVALTTLAGIWFLAATWNDTEAMQQLLLWPARLDYAHALDEQMRRESGPTLQNFMNDPQYSEAKVRARHDQLNHQHQFHPWQLVSYAVLRDPNARFSSVVHLVGDLLFLFFFGTRVNAIIGNLAMAVVYLALAIIAGVVYLLAQPPDQIAPLSGASGAIAGLAGMYLMLLPAHRVYCAAWIRWFRIFAMKIFALRGFWLVPIYFAWEALRIAVASPGHSMAWVDLGGVAAGVVIALALLMSRKVNCGNGDLLSVVLGRHAWPLIGKPNRWAAG